MSIIILNKNYSLMNTFTLACLVGLASSTRILVDLSAYGDGGNATNATNSTDFGYDYEPWVDPCAEFEPDCGEWPCSHITHPCDNIVDDDEWS